MSEAAPLVSILVPAFNAQPWIAATLESVLAQDWRPIEVIVVDDGSTDATARLVQAFSNSGVVLISTANQGASAARNRALADSRGEWIQFLDADDLLEPSKISRQMALAARCGSDHVICGDWARFVSDTESAALDQQSLCADSDPVDWVVRKFEMTAMVHPGAWLSPRALLEAAGPWDTRLSLDDDGEYFTRVVLASQGVRHCPGSLSYYRSQVAGSLSRGRSSAAHRSALLAASLSADRLLGAEDSERTRRACANMFAQLCFSIYPDDCDIVSQAEARARECHSSWPLPPGGIAMKSIARILGWKAALRIQRSYRRLRGSRGSA